MVTGIDKFREYFRDFSDHYIIIGGTARDYAVSEAGFTPKGTKDIDIVLIIEALSEFTNLRVLLWKSEGESQKESPRFIKSQM